MAADPPRAGRRESTRCASPLFALGGGGGEPFAFNGKYNQLRYVNIWPRPVQKKLPIWVPGGGGSVETWDLVIKHDYCYGHLSFSGLYSSKPLVDGFWEYLSKHNGNMNPHRMAFTQ